MGGDGKHGVEPDLPPKRALLWKGNQPAIALTLDMGL